MVNIFKVKDIALLKNCLRTKVIPITIAAKQLKTMQIAANYAYIWERSYLNPEQFVSFNKKLENICKKTNQDEGRRIIKSIELDVIISESDSDLKYKKRIFAIERFIYGQSDIQTRTHWNT